MLAESSETSHYLERPGAGVELPVTHQNQAILHFCSQISISPICTAEVQNICTSVIIWSVHATISKVVMIMLNDDIAYCK